MDATDVSPWLTRAEAAKRARLSPRTLDRAMRNGKLEYSGGGGTGLAVRIHVDDVDAWLATRRTHGKAANGIAVTVAAVFGALSFAGPVTANAVAPCHGCAVPNAQRLKFKLARRRLGSGYGRNTRRMRIHLP